MSHIVKMTSAQSIHRHNISNKRIALNDGVDKLLMLCIQDKLSLHILHTYILILYIILQIVSIGI